MCTVVTYKGNGNYVARNLDVAFSYNEEAVFVPRNVKFNFRHIEDLTSHYSIIGIGTRIKDVPLFYEACNEYGLFIAGLNFPGNAKYYDYQDDKHNLAPWELTPYLLGSFKTVKEVSEFLKELNILNEPYMENLPNAPLHYYISDKDEAIIIETTEDGMNVYPAEYKTMTNNPPYPQHKQYADMILAKVSNDYKKASSVEEQCVGLAGVGLPGDASSKSRFVKAAFLAKYQTEKSYTGEIMHGVRIMDQVSMMKGTVKCEDNSDDYTVYSVVYDLDNFKMYYKLYDSSSAKYAEFESTDKNLSNYVYAPLERNEFF